jgi:hypothetical protein
VRVTVRLHVQKLVERGRVATTTPELTALVRRVLSTDTLLSRGGAVVVMKPAEHRNLW